MVCVAVCACGAASDAALAGVALLGSMCQVCAPTRTSSLSRDGRWRRHLGVELMILTVSASFLFSTASYLFRPMELLSDLLYPVCTSWRRALHLKQLSAFVRLLKQRQMVQMEGVSDGAERHTKQRLTRCACGR